MPCRTGRSRARPGFRSGSRPPPRSSPPCSRQLAALATARAAPFRGMLTTYVLLNFPLMVPEIITAIATLSFFAVLGIERGFLTVVAGAYLLLHSVRLYADPRAIGGDGPDPGAGRRRSLRHPGTTFRRITLPLLFPGILAGAMLAFIVSIDDYIITSFVAGPGWTTCRSTSSPRFATSLRPRSTPFPRSSCSSRSVSSAFRSSPACAGAGKLPACLN